MIECININLICYSCRNAAKENLEIRTPTDLRVQSWCGIIIVINKHSKRNSDHHSGVLHKMPVHCKTPSQYQNQSESSHILSNSKTFHRVSYTKTFTIAWTLPVAVLQINLTSDFKRSISISPSSICCRSCLATVFSVSKIWSRWRYFCIKVSCSVARFL